MTSALVVLALLAGAGWYFSSKRGNPMRSNANAAIYCTGAAVVLLAFLIYSIVSAARDDKTESGPGYAMAVLTTPFLVAFVASAWIYIKRARAQRHRAPDESARRIDDQSHETP